MIKRHMAVTVSRPMWYRLTILAGVVCMTVWAGTGCRSDEQIKKADGYFKEGAAVLNTDQQSAYVSFQKALKEDPYHRDAHYYIGYIYAYQVKYPQAEEEVREALRIDPDYPEAHNFLGQLLVAQNRWEESIREFRKALEYPLYATPDVAYYQLGLALEHEADTKGAVEAFENGLRVSPPNVPQAWLHLGIGRVRYKMGEYDKARESLARAVALDREKGASVAAEAKRLMERIKP